MIQVKAGACCRLAWGLHPTGECGLTHAKETQVKIPLKRPLLLLAVLAPFAASPAWSQSSAAHDHGHGQTTQVAQVAQAAGSVAEGEVRKVDKANGKVTIKHGEIKALNMPPMTMVYPVTDVAMLDKVKAGDKVQFTATSDGGKLTVTGIKPAK